MEYYCLDENPGVRFKLHTGLDGTPTFSDPNTHRNEVDSLSYSFDLLAQDPSDPDIFLGNVLHYNEGVPIGGRHLVILRRQQIPEAEAKKSFLQEYKKPLLIGFSILTALALSSFFDKQKH